MRCSDDPHRHVALEGADHARVAQAVQRHRFGIATDGLYDCGNVFAIGVARSITPRLAVALPQQRRIGGAAFGRCLQLRRQRWRDRHVDALVLPRSAALRAALCDFGIDSLGF